jgi:hypothetical protein
MEKRSNNGLKKLHGKNQIMDEKKLGFKKAEAAERWEGGHGQGSDTTSPVWRRGA